MADSIIIPAHLKLSLYFAGSRPHKQTTSMEKQNDLKVAKFGVLFNAISTTHLGGGGRGTPASMYTVLLLWGFKVISTVGRKGPGLVRVGLRINICPSEGKSWALYRNVRQPHCQKKIIF